MKRLLISALLILSSKGYADSIESVIHHSLKTNPEICGKHNEYVSSRELVNQANSRTRPQGRIEYNYGRERVYNSSTKAALGGGSHFWRNDVNLNVSQSIYDAGNRKSFIRQKRADANFSHAQLREKREQIAFQAAEVYLNVIRHRKIVSIYAQDVESHRNMFEKIEKKVNAGAGKKSETYLAQSRLSLAESRLFTAEGRLSEAENRFVELVGFAPAKDLPLPQNELPVPEDVDQALCLSKKINPSLFASYANVASSNAQSQVSKSALYPEVSFDFNVFNGNDLNGVPGGNFNINGLLNVSWDFYTSGGNRSIYQSDRALYYNSLANLEETKRMITNNVSTAFDFLESDLKRLGSLINHKAESYEVYLSYQKEFDLGKRSLFDLLNSKLEYYNSYVSEVDGTFDLYIDHYRLLASVGNLVKTIEHCCQRR